MRATGKATSSLFGTLGARRGEIKSTPLSQKMGRWKILSNPIRRWLEEVSKMLLIMQTLKYGRNRLKFYTLTIYLPLNSEQSLSIVHLLSFG